MRHASGCSTAPPARGFVSRDDGRLGARGVRWQIVPRRFTELLGDPDPRKVQAAVTAMLGMVKLDVAELERAHAEA